MADPVGYRESWYRLIAAFLLLLFFVQVVTAATQTSITSDEGPQLTSGYAYLVTGNPHLIEFDAHPPLAKVINSLPLLLVPDLGSPADVPAWVSDDPISLIWVTEQFLYPYRPLDRLVVAGRLPVALWGLLLAALTYRWATDFFGPVAGVMALFLVIFDPNILAHAGVATNDLPLAAASLAALFTFWRFLRRPTAGRALLAGLLLGVAQGTKLSALLLLPAQLTLALAHAALTDKPDQESDIRHLASWIARCAAVWIVAALALWASYGFELREISGWPFPVPAGTHLTLWERVAGATEGGHPGFLMGEISTTGWLHYFPLAFAIKTPLPTLLVLLGAVSAFFIGWRRRLLDELVLVLFVLFFGAFAIFSRLNIGYRHILPALPLLYVFAGRVFERTHWLSWQAQWRRRVAAGLAIALGIWLVAGTVAIWPFHLAYFNELIGGPDRGYQYLVDSNTDWGQALKALAAYLEREEIDRVRLSTYIEYGSAIEGYGIDMSPLPPLRAAPGVLPARFNPPPGVYVISTTTLQGIFTADPEMYDWFRKREPDARIGHVMFLYHIREPTLPSGWVAQCLDPVAPLPPQVIAEGFGRADLRRAYFDCMQSWLIPNGGDSRGWYVLFRDTARTDDLFIQTQLTQTRLSFEQAERGVLPPFAIYEVQGFPMSPIYPATATTVVGDLVFLGHTVREDRFETKADQQVGRSIEVWTYWRVQALPKVPLSLMLHLVGPAGAPVLVGDGLGVPVENWQAGDVIIQRHRLDLPPAAPSGDYALYTGAYWLDTLERWPVTIEDKPAGDQVALPPLSVAASE